MGIRFFKEWLLFWHPNFENVGAYKYVRIFLFIIRFIVVLFAIATYIDMYNNIEQLNYFDAQDAKLITFGFVFDAAFVYMLLEILVLYFLYLCTKYQQ